MRKHVHQKCVASFVTNCQHSKSDHVLDWNTFNNLDSCRQAWVILKRLNYSNMTNFNTLLFPELLHGTKEIKFKILSLFEMKQPWNLNLIFKVDQLGLHLLQHMFYIVHTETFSVKVSSRSSLLNVSLWRCGVWTCVKRGVKTCMFLIHLYPNFSKSNMHTS